MELLLKWVGGKKKYCNIIYDFIKKNNIEINDFYEPFFGSGALTFFLMKKNVTKNIIANDMNHQLIWFYNNVKYNVNELIAQIKKISVSDLDKIKYYELRQKYNSDINNSSIENSALFYFINKTCFNGIYRVNSNGNFNTPCGSYLDKFYIKEENFKKFSKYLKKCKFLKGDWENAIKNSKKGDLIYLDPPYYIDSSSKFIGYTDPKFDLNSYKKMLIVMKNKVEIGVNIIMSNSNSIELYNMIEKKFGNNFYREEYVASRTINPKVNKIRKKEFVEVIFFFKGK